MYKKELLYLSLCFCLQVQQPFMQKQQLTNALS